MKADDYQNNVANKYEDYDRKCDHQRFQKLPNILFGIISIAHRMNLACDDEIE